MKLVKFDKEKHYPKLREIWEHYGWLPCPIEFLPKTGYVALRDDETFIAALFMYLEPGSVAMPTWATGSREVMPQERQAAFAELFNTLKSIAVEHGCTFLYGVTASTAFKKMMESWGMLPVETNMQSFVMPLCGDDPAFLKD